MEIENRLVVVDDGNGIFGATSQPAAVLVTSTGRRISSNTPQLNEKLEEVWELVRQIAVRVGVGFRQPK